MALRLTIDERVMEAGAMDWWASLTPSERGVFMQALWEIQREPSPRTDSDRLAVKRELEAS